MRTPLLCLLAAALPCGTAAAQCDTLPIHPADAGQQDLFGKSLDVDGDVAIVGASQLIVSGPGKAYIYRQVGSGWVEEDLLAPPDGSFGDAFGTAVAVDGDVAVVGARSHGSNGAAYVYERVLEPATGAPSWEFVQKLDSGGASSGSEYGTAVSISGDVICVGAYEDDAAGTQAGTVFAYRRDAGGWQPTQEIRAAGTGNGDFFGHSVDLWGDLLLVGAVNESGKVSRSGAAYVFRYDGQAWTEQERLEPGSPTEEGRFGYDVDFDETTGADEDLLIAISAPAQVVFGSPSTTEGGGVFMYSSPAGDPTTWLYEDTLASSNSLAGDFFGASVDVRAGRVLVGAPFVTESLNDAGAVYLFEPGLYGWLQVDYIRADDSTIAEHFGEAVGQTGDWLLATAPLHDKQGPPGELKTSDAGALVARLADVSACMDLCNAPRLLTSDLGTLDALGASVAITGDTALVGVPGADTVFPNTGQVRAYRNLGDCWVLEGILQLDNPTTGDRFGAAIAVEGGRAYIGAPYWDGLRINQGAVFVYEGAGGAWSLVAQLGAKNPIDDELFGSSIAVNATKAVVGAPTDGSERGRIYDYRLYPTPSWGDAYPKYGVDGHVGDRFGASLATYSSRVAVGAPDMIGPDGHVTGAVHVFAIEGTLFKTLKHKQVVYPDGLPEDTGFGTALAMDFNEIYAGAPDHLGSGRVFHLRDGSSAGVDFEHEGLLGPVEAAYSTDFGAALSSTEGLLAVGDPNAGPAGEGRVHLLREVAGEWTEDRVLRPVGPAALSRFGSAVSISAATLLVGAPDDSKHAPGGGAAWAFEPDAEAVALAADVRSLSLTPGGSQGLLLDAGPSHAGKLSFVLGSASGTAPGVDFGTALLPLNPDAYYAFTIQEANTAMFVNTLAFLDGVEGTSTASIVLPAGLSVAHAGLVLDYAYLVLGPGSVDLASNPVSLTLIP